MAALGCGVDWTGRRSGIGLKLRLSRLGWTGLTGGGPHYLNISDSVVKTANQWSIMGHIKMLKRSKSTVNCLYQNLNKEYDITHNKTLLQALSMPINVNEQSEHQSQRFKVH